MNQLRNITIALLLVAVHPAIGQENTDYIVTNKGDTVRGKTRIISFDADQAQVVVDGKKKTFAATQVVVLRMNGDLYRAFPRTTTYRFMKLLYPGYLSLYGFREGSLPSYDNRFLVKKDGKTMDVPNLSFRKSMAAFLSDCPQVSGLIESGQLARRDLDKIITQYNLCIDNETRLRFDQAKVVTAKSDPKLASIDQLKAKVDGLPDFANRQNALDLINDIREKITKGATIPNYQVEGLKEYLGTNEGVKDELAQFIELTKKN